MKRIVSLFLFLSLWMASWAQSLSVASYNELPNDLDARVNYQRLDPQTGKKYAIIKVVTTQKGFVFDIGQLAMGGTEVHSDLSEIWVYVPEGTKKLKITHPQLGQLKTETNDGFYWLPSVTRSAWCYRLELVSGIVTTTVEAPKQQTGWLLVESNPSGADVVLMVNGTEINGVTPFQKKLAYGDYYFRLSKPLYYDEVGVAHIDQGQVQLSATLLPAHGWIAITSNPSGARVSIEGLRETFTTPCTTDMLASGKYKVRLTKDRYIRSEQEVVVVDGKISSLNENLVSNFAKVEINSQPSATIWVDGSQVAIGSYKGELAPGVYDIESRLASYETAKRQIVVEANKPQTLTLTPTPIYGSLDVVCTPVRADITINGKSYGQTPKTIDNLLIGTYSVTLSKSGYSPKTSTVEIFRDKTEELNITLSERTNITFRSDPAGATIYVDGEEVGFTPISLSLTFGKHSVLLVNPYDSISENITIQNKSEYHYHLKSREEKGFAFEEETYEVDDDEIYVFVEETPEFPGGIEQMYKYLRENIEYPDAARTADIQGKVFVRFVVEKNGKITNVKVMRDIGCGCGQEAKRVVEKMPRWKPGKQRGKAVRAEYTLPVDFRLN